MSLYIVTAEKLEHLIEASKKYALEEMILDERGKNEAFGPAEEAFLAADAACREVEMPNALPKLLALVQASREAYENDPYQKNLGDALAALEDEE